MKRNTIRLTESQLHRVIEESVKRVLSEENENASNPEWISNVCHIVIFNNRDLWDIYDWIVNCIVKKMKRGINPIFEQLANSSTMKKLVREAFKVNGINSRMHRQEFMKVCNEPAQSIINDANERLG